MWLDFCLTGKIDYDRDRRESSTTLAMPKSNSRMGASQTIEGARVKYHLGDALGGPPEQDVCASPSHVGRDGDRTQTTSLRQRKRVSDRNDERERRKKI